MLNFKMQKLHAAWLVIAIVAALALWLVGPAKVFHDDDTFGGGAFQTESEMVTDAEDAGIYFTAQGEHLQTIRLFISTLESGDQMIFQLFHVVDGLPQVVAQETVPVIIDELPGFVSVSTDVDVVPGDQYIYIVRGTESSFRVGLTPMTDVLTAPNAMQQEIGFHNDTTIDGLTVMTESVYRRPWSHKKQAVFEIGILALALAAAGILWGLSKIFPKYNGPITVLRLMQCVLTPVIAVAGAVTILAIFPGRMFDSRWRDVLMYECGAVFAVCVALYGLWHGRDGVPADDSFGAFRSEWNHYVIIGAIAAALGYSSYYMNATYEQMHVDGERGIMVCLLIVLLMMQSRKSSGQNTTRRFNALMLIPLSVFLLMMLIFRNGRLWIVKLLILWAVFFVRYCFWNEKNLWLRDVCVGISLNFGVTILWSMMRRYYLAYEFSRFSMQFFTVTVTAYYILIAAAAAFTLFLMKAPRVKGLSLRVKVAFLWKELFLLGMVCSYMLMSITRSGIFALVLMALVAVVLTANGSAGRVLCNIGAMLLATMIAFPIAFSGQRIISTVVGNPVIFTDVDVYPDVVLRNVKWNSTRFMNVEIFLRDFADRIFGGEIGTKWYMDNGHYEKQGHWTAGLEESEHTGYSKDRSSYLLTAKPLTLLLTEDAADEDWDEEDLEAQEATEWEHGDYSNGRMVVWRTYLANLNLTGHDIMGVTLESGEVTAHAHNIVLQMAYDCGIPTGIMFGLVLLLTLVQAWIYDRRYRTEADGIQARWSLMPLLTIGGFGITGLVEWIFQLCNPYTLVLMMIMMPLIFDQKMIEGDR